MKKVDNLKQAAHRPRRLSYKAHTAVETRSLIPESDGLSNNKEVKEAYAAL